jgi:ribosomal-protein-serine acetyltransferase
MVTVPRSGALRHTSAPATLSASARVCRRPAPWLAPDPLPTRFDTARTTLRFWCESDAAELLAAVNEDRTSLLPWLSCFRADYRTLGQCYYNIDRFRRQHQSPETREYIIGVFDRCTGAVIGGTGFYQVDRESHSAEIGYWLRPSRRGGGLCAEMVRGLLSWSFTPQDAGGWGLRRAEIFCAGGNTASRRIPQALGLRQEYAARAARWIDGVGWDDTIGWGVTADEWDCRRLTLRTEAKASSAIDASSN